MVLFSVVFKGNCYKAKNPFFCGEKYYVKETIILHKINLPIEIEITNIKGVILDCFYFLLYILPLFWLLAAFILPLNDKTKNAYIAQN